MQYNIIFISCQEVTVHSLTRSNRLIVYAKMAISYYILSDISHPNEKYLVSSSCKSISPPFAKLTVCIAVLPAFYSIAARRSLCTTFCYSSLRVAPKVLIHGKRMPKINIFVFWHPFSMDRCFASARSTNKFSAGGALVPLRGGF